MIKNTKKLGGGGYLAAKNNSILAQNRGYSCKNELNSAFSLKNFRYLINDNDYKLDCNKTNINASYKRVNKRLPYFAKAKRLSITQLCLWFLLLCTVVVLTLTPIFSSKKFPVNAGQTSVRTQFTNAPWVKVNDGTALFTSGSGINATTLYDLLLQVNKSQVWVDSATNTALYKTETSVSNPTISAGQNVYYLSAKNFGKLNDGSANQSAKGNAQIQVKLFDGAALDPITTTEDANLDINGATTVLWQVVYRSMALTDSTGQKNDVLTLYMNNKYCTTEFGDSYGYYGGSIIRQVAKGTYEKLKATYTILDNYIVAPQNIPGLWQSSEYQTGQTTATFTDRVSTFTKGASKAFSTASYDAINNGLDGATNDDTDTVLYTKWTATTTTTDTYSDKLWVPSNYEVIYRGSVTDGTTSSLTAYLSSSDESTWLNNGESGGSDEELDGRSGLWEVNGYDRACGSSTWLRSGNSQEYYEACGFSWSGNHNEGTVGGNDGVRVALHLNLGSLANAILASISASANAPTGVTSPSFTIGGYDQTLQTVKPTFNYSNYVIPSSNDESKGKRTITFGAVNTSTHKISSFELQKDSTTQTINVTGASGSGTCAEICDYSYTYSNGQLVVSVGNVSGTGELKVQANVVEAQTDMTLNLQVTNSAPNSLLVLTIMNGTTELGEYGFVYSGGEQTVSVTLPKNTTIKILATKPFGSRVEFEFDNVAVSPSGVTSYLINTGNASSKNLTATLTGDGSWSNAIII